MSSSATLSMSFRHLRWSRSSGRALRRIVDHWAEMTGDERKRMLHRLVTSLIAKVTVSPVMSENSSTRSGITPSVDP